MGITACEQDKKKLTGPITLQTDSKSVAPGILSSTFGSSQPIRRGIPSSIRTPQPC